MIADIELDRILRAFVAEGGDLAPQGDVEAALAQVAVTPQRRPRPWSRDPMPQPPSPRLILAVGALLILAIGIAVGVGAVVRRAPVSPPDDLPPAPSPAVVQAPVSLVPFSAADWAVRLKIPAGWTDVGPKVSEYRHFAGDEPQGHLSVTNENPYGTTVCDPECANFGVPGSIPYDSVAQLAGLRASIGQIAGSDAWADLPADVLPDMQGGSRLDTTSVSADGTEWRRVHVVGLRARNLVVIAWSQPVADYDEPLLEAILDGIVLSDAPIYTDGDLIPYDGGLFTMSVPGVWSGAEQPSLDGSPLSGVRRFGDTGMVVSFGDPDGTFGWCDPGCRTMTDVTTLDALETAIRRDTDLGPSTSITLGGEPARSMIVEAPVARRVVIALHDRRAVAIRLDPGGWIVAAGTFDEMIRSFAFVNSVAPPPGQYLTAAGGRVRLGLSAAWQRATDDDTFFEMGSVRMAVRAGDDDGRIMTCDSPAGPWDLCREFRPASLDDLADAVQPGPLDDHGIGPPIRTRDATTLGGEPAVITRIEAYEYPAKGGQVLVYIVAMHDGRPFIVRIHTRENSLAGVEAIVAGFSFVD